MAGVTAGGGARAEEGDDIRAATRRPPGQRTTTRSAPMMILGTTRPAGSGPVPARRRGPHIEPALGVTPHLDEEPAPWAGLGPQIPQTPALKDRPEPANPAPAAPRRGRGQHAARHGKPSRRSRGEG